MLNIYDVVVAFPMFSPARFTLTSLSSPANSQEILADVSTPSSTVTDVMALSSAYQRLRLFSAFLELMDEFHPRYLIHGHQHLNYRTFSERVLSYGQTEVINACGRYEINLEPGVFS